MTEPVEDRLVHPADRQALIRLWLRMLACTTLVESELRKQIRLQFDSTLPRFEILALLDRRPGGMMLSELSKQLMVSAGNVTPIIERLIADGLVTRTASEIDRRVQIVRLTAEGRRTFRPMAKKHGELIGDILGDLSPAQVETLTLLLTQTRDAVVAATRKPEPALRRRASA